MLKSFFVAFNRSPHAMAALDWTCYLAAQTRGRVHISHVIEIVNEPVISSGMLAGAIETMAIIPPVEAVREVEIFRRECAAHAEELFARAREVCARWGVECETSILTGYIEEEIAQQAQAVDLLALGLAAAEGGRKVTALTESVARTSPAPVLIATAPFVKPEELFVFYDGTRCTIHALQLGAEIARQAGLRLTLITAPASGEEAEVVSRRAGRYLHDHDLEFDSLAVRPHADLERELARTLAGHPSALLVLGCFGESRLRQWLLGSATRPVLERTTNPAIIFRS